MMAATLAGCGSTSNETTTQEGGETAETGGDGYSMTLIMSLRDEFLSTLEAGAQSAASELGVTLLRRTRITTQARPSSLSSLHATQAMTQFW